MIGSERRDAGKRHRLAGAAIRDDGTERKHEALRREEHDRRIAMLMVGGSLRVMVMMRCILAAVLVRRGLLRDMVLLMPARARTRTQNAARQGIGKVHVVIRMLDLVHQRDIGLAGQHHRQRHAKDGDGAAEDDVSAEAQTDLARGAVNSNTGAA